MADLDERPRARGRQQQRDHGFLRPVREAADPTTNGLVYNVRTLVNTLRFVLCGLALLAATSERSLAESQSSQARGASKIDVNTASVKELETLPGVNANVANQIVANRPYESVEQFKSKSGLSATESNALTPLVTAQPLGPVRQPRLPPGAVPISPESFSKGFKPPSPAPGESRGPVPNREVFPVPPGTVRRIPLPPGTVTRNIPVPGPHPPSTPVRNMRDALVYGVSAVVLGVATVVWMRRTSPRRKSTRNR